MTQSTLEELRKTVELLKEVETLQDESVRVRMQRHILDLMGPTPAPTVLTATTACLSAAETQELLAHAVGPGPRAEPPRHIAAFPQPGTLRGKVYEAVAELATVDRPLSATELEQVLPELGDGKLSKTLSQLWSDGLLARVQRDEMARDGYERGLYKYYVPQIGS